MFWGGILILVGIAILVGNILDVNVWRLLWPAVLILLGVWVILGVTFGRRTSVEEEQAIVPLEGAADARVRIQHGAGRLRIGPGAGPGELVSGSFGGGLDLHSREEAGTLNVNLRMPSRGFPGFFVFPWGPSGAFEWSVKLTGEIPLSLRVDSGASESHIDLTDLRVTGLRLKTGASSNVVHLPAKAGHTEVDIDAGVASVRLRVPEGVAAQIRISGGLSGISVDRNRFPRVGGRGYRSPDYDTAENKVDIAVDVGVGSVDIR
jgi:hypothetical protein